ncbi:glycosyltransferase [Alkalimarinus alittae]|uniref:Glycosyltransferase n=1 Tax=Alkalimarinus alittae TaxID=2961619 RepID=A0ABY6N777_9ALTE|nr:glycosyltransferase [Alkalimarinus alittae]UZE97973.1 glycosyltransferase [Alkalimarinus alittae]
MKNDNHLWVCWEDHRRSRELAKALNYTYTPLIHAGNRLRRYPVLIVKTVRLIKEKKPTVVICQNPSIVLTFLLCCLKKINNFKLIVDRHTNFKFKTIKSWNPKWRIFHFLSKLTIKYADLTIVTNEPLKEIVEEWGGKGFVLQDKLPELDKGKITPLEGRVNIAFVCTYSDDEPYEKVIKLFNTLPEDIHLYVTGNFNKWVDLADGKIVVPKNVHLLGFVDEEQYQSLIKSVDIVMVLTDLEYVLNCGAYEAISVDKPLILSDTLTIRSYFKYGITYTKLDESSLVQSIKDSVNNKDKHSWDIIDNKIRMVSEWEGRKANLEAVVSSL